MILNRVSILFLITAFFAGCQTLTPTEELTAKVAVKIAIKKYISQGDVEQRATKIIALVQDAGSVVDAVETFSLEVLDIRVRSKIDWKGLDDDETLLVDGLLIVIRAELEARLEETNGLSAAEALSVKKVFGWIEEAANSKLRE